mgnify:FL=1
MKEVVNGYTIQRFSSDGRNGIFIHYLKDGNIFTHSKYYDVDDDKILEVRKRLNDYTSINQKETEFCRTLSLVTMIDAVENIIFDRYPRKAK